MKTLPYVTREFCTCNIDPKGHYHYDREIWINWFRGGLADTGMSFLTARDHIKAAIESRG